MASLEMVDKPDINEPGSQSGTYSLITRSMRRSGTSHISATTQ